MSPLVATTHRATYFSLGSLGGRLGYGTVLLALGTSDDFATVRGAVGIIAVALLVLVSATALLARGPSYRAGWPAATER